MHNLLTKLLEKRKIASPTELESEEKTVFDNWEKILSEGEITIEKIKDFCKQQINIIETIWKDANISQIAIERLVRQHIVYKTLLTLIESPLQEREHLERYLTNLIKE